MTLILSILQIHEYIAATDYITDIQLITIPGISLIPAMPYIIPQM